MTPVLSQSPRKDEERGLGGRSSLATSRNKSLRQMGPPEILAIDVSSEPTIGGRWVRMKESYYGRSQFLTDFRTFRYNNAVPMRKRCLKN